MTISVDQTLLAQIGELGKGSHEPPNGPPSDGELCIMEAVAFVAREPWSDHPQCACPIISAFLRSWNDNLPDDKRTRLLKPLIPLLVGTRGSNDLERRRVILINDWLIRVDTPAWLRLAGLEKQALALESLPEITDFETTPSLRAALETAERDAEAEKVDASAASAARDAWAASAARAARAAWAASAARDASAARAARAAWDASAARDARAAWAAWDAELKATVDHLDQSAVALIERLCALRD